MRYCIIDSVREVRWVIKLHRFTLDTLDFSCFQDCKSCTRLYDPLMITTWCDTPLLLSCRGVLQHPSVHADGVASWVFGHASERDSFEANIVTYWRNGRNYLSCNDIPLHNSIIIHPFAKCCFALAGCLYLAVALPESRCPSHRSATQNSTAFMTRYLPSRQVASGLLLTTSASNDG